MKSIKEIIEQKPWVGWVLFFATAIIVFLAGLFAASIVERRTEARLYFEVFEPIADYEPRMEVWGENFPRQYQTYLQTQDTTFESKYYGSVMIDYLDKYPELVILWAGYAFARDYNQGRGHYYSVADVHNTLRTVQEQPATCWTCKSSDVPRVMAEIGPEKFYATSWRDMGSQIVNPVSCLDCHDPKTMNLRISRPALIEAFERRGKDVTKATHQEMRSLVCAQCHVEYYFGENNYLIFPWDDGLSAEEMEYYFDRIEFTDWTHALSRAPMLKTQHPDYELWKTGIHAERGVSCADCHMPYKRDGGVKFTNHHITSPLQNIESTCQVCHREGEEKLRQIVYDRQKKISQMRRIAERNLARVHIEAKAAWDAGATEEEMQDVLQLIRHSQWRWDWIAAANSMGFHSPAEALSVLGSSVQKAQEARILLSRILAKYDVTQPVEMPDISTKEKAQEYLGLDMSDIKAEKESFLQVTVPEWLEEAKKREAGY